MNTLSHTTIIKPVLGPFQSISIKQFLKHAIMITVVILSALSVIYTKHQTRMLYSELQQLQQKRDKLHIEWSQLLLEKGAWANDARVERIAREKLGMAMPERNELIVIKQ